MTVREFVERLGLDAAADELLVGEVLDGLHGEKLSLFEVEGVFVDEENGRVVLTVGDQLPHESLNAWGEA